MIDFSSMFHSFIYLQPEAGLQEDRYHQIIIKGS